MFDIGLIEVSIILLVALFAIGPERMPEVARFLVKTKRLMNKISSDIKLLWDKVDAEDEEKNSDNTR